jgi:spermidine synthase
MCLGSLLLPRLVPAWRHALRVYAAIELGIGLLGILILFLMPFTGSAVVVTIFLLPPTLLMGATLPALSRAMESAPGCSSSLGFLYAANIAGAVLGCLLSGFYLLRHYDVAAATYVAASVNAAVAVTAVLMLRPGPAAKAGAAPVPDNCRSRAPVYTAIAISGLCALAAETVWTRTLGLLFGASVYALSIILAVFLTGLGIGSALGSHLSRIVSQPRLALGSCQLLAAGAIAWTAYNLGASLPYWPINPSISSNIWFSFELDLARGFWALLPPTLLWGASFPLALAAVSEEPDAAKLVGRVYAANTLGAIVGALGSSLFLVAWIGSQGAEQVIIGLSTAAGLLLLVGQAVPPANRPKAGVRSWSAFGRGAAAVLLTGALIYTVPPISKLLIAYGRYAATWVGKSDIVYAGEGINSSVAVARFSSGALTFHVAGKIQASNVPRDMRLQRMLGHLTTLTASHPSSVLVIGCGAGITAGAVSIDPQVERETIVEIEPFVPRVAATYFSEPNFEVLHNPKVRVRIDDGRHYLLTSKERFDGITIDPLDPWVKGAANLYTKEFFEAMKRHLGPGGVVTMYIQLFETNLEAVKSSLATFFEVFPNGTIWGNTYEGRGHDMVLLGQVEPLRIDLDRMEQRVGYRGGESKIAQSLAEVGMNSPVELFATFAGRGSELRQRLRNAAINRDRNLRMQYLAGLGLNLDESAAIYASLLAYRLFPEDIFVSAEGRIDSLRRAIQRQP